VCYQLSRASILVKVVGEKDALKWVFNGADHAVLDKMPDFAKSISVEVALATQDKRRRSVHRDAIQHGLAEFRCVRTKAKATSGKEHTR